MGIDNLSNTGLATIWANDMNTALGANAVVKIYTGSPPNDASVAATGTLLATLACSSSAFGTVTAGISGGAPPYITANAITSANGVATGVPGYGRLLSTGGTAVEDLDIGASGSGASIIMTPDSITVGAPVSITSLTLTMP